MCTEVFPVSHVLVVDDSKVMREMIAACLKPGSALTVTQASSGLEAIEKLSLQPFDVMVLDLNMPDIGGIEVLEFVRSQDKLRALPILIVTTRGDDGSRTKAMAAGATRYLTKPFTPEAILDEVSALVAAPTRAPA
jgi:two-component system, chemotaxis family, chemotaxis protein CheY